MREFPHLRRWSRNVNGSFFEMPSGNLACHGEAHIRLAGFDQLPALDQFLGKVATRLDQERA